ncbi:TspO/MBR family protein, partial [Neglectibacter timonensis]
MIKLKPLLLSLLISLGTGGLAALFTGNSMEFYQSLKQPPLSPPGWVFPLAWTILYSLMGVAAYLVWMRDSTGRNGALFFYGLQLIFNFVWPLLFFNARAYLASLIWLLLLW